MNIYIYIYIYVYVYIYIYIYICIYIGVLQRSENHMLALRVLLSSWHVSDSKAELLRSSLLALSRKVLGYRQIDTSLAVACLVMLPFDLMVRELKAAVPSIQSDFSRLRTVASVGEELSRLWEQDSLLVVFQGLQTNAKWWHILSSYGVKIDPRAFQSSDTTQRVLCIRYHVLYHFIICMLTLLLMPLAGLHFFM
jgi:hypothetical protein